MAKYVTARAPMIYAELISQKRNVELALAQALFKKHGVSMELKVPEPDYV